MFREFLVGLGKVRWTSQHLRGSFPDNPTWQPHIYPGHLRRRWNFMNPLPEDRPYAMELPRFYRRFTETQ